MRHQPSILSVRRDPLAIEALRACRTTGKYGDCDEDESEGPDDLLAAEVVRFEPIAHIPDVAVVGVSPMGHCGPMPEMRIHRMIESFMRPRGRGTWVIRQKYFVRCHATPRRGLFSPDSRKLLEGVHLQVCRMTRVRRFSSFRRIGKWWHTPRPSATTWTTPDNGSQRLDCWWRGIRNAACRTRCRPRLAPSHFHQRFTQSLGAPTLGSISIQGTIPFVSRCSGTSSSLRLQTLFGTG